MCMLTSIQATSNHLNLPAIADPPCCAPGNILVTPRDEGHAPGLCFIDVGLVTSLGPEDRTNFVELFAAVAQGRGEDAARYRSTDERARERLLNGLPHIFNSGFEIRLKQFCCSTLTSTWI